MVRLNITGFYQVTRFINKLVRGVGSPPIFTSKIFTPFPLIWGFLAILGFYSCILGMHSHIS